MEMKKQVKALDAGELTLLQLCIIGFPAHTNGKPALFGNQGREPLYLYPAKRRNMIPPDPSERVVVHLEGTIYQLGKQRRVALILMWIRSIELRTVVTDGLWRFGLSLFHYTLS